MMRANQRPDTTAAINWRIKSREAADAAIADRQAQFPVLTDANADAAIAYQEARIKFHETRLGIRTADH